jgi:hypothetical protein
MLSSLALSVARSSAATCTSAPMLGAVAAVARHIRPWLSLRRGVAAQACVMQTADSDSDVEQPTLVSQLAASSSRYIEKPAPIPAVPGRIHSVDTFSAVDGPGLRMVVFEQVRAPSAWGCGGSFSQLSHHPEAGSLSQCNSTP